MRLPDNPSTTLLVVKAGAKAGLELPYHFNALIVPQTAISVIAIACADLRAGA